MSAQTDDERLAAIIEEARASFNLANGPRDNTATVNQAIKQLKTWRRESVLAMLPEWPEQADMRNIEQSPTPNYIFGYNAVVQELVVALTKGGQD